MGLKQPFLAQCERCSRRLKLWIDVDLERPDLEAKRILTEELGWKIFYLSLRCPACLEKT